MTALPGECPPTTCLAGRSLVICCRMDTLAAIRSSLKIPSGINTAFCPAIRNAPTAWSTAVMRQAQLTTRSDRSQVCAAQSKPFYNITSHIPDPGRHCQRFYGAYSNRARISMAAPDDETAGATRSGPAAGAISSLRR